MPNVYNKHKDKIPKDAIYIGRPSIYGNPYVIGVDGIRNEVIDKHEEDLQYNPRLVNIIKRELYNKDLVCFCKPQKCHGDTLLKVANTDYLDGLLEVTKDGFIIENHILRDYNAES